ncbi:MULTISPECIES: GlxA family transcriptional regulator [unclassified Mesorhizobium]|uniref:GlxA family transcriptional regulator n=1 Tax=unclassified Mesorhizobium TaxID=325217 RepID=UPI001CCE07EE|nr:MULTISPECIES: GlxA family transcriptional regulator [unclassified Mesorhizobium]MBZ9799081.1 GlxA family transcriptional regulator [Mesorhizobium sp. ES1-4]
MSLFIDTLRLAGDDGDRSRRGRFDWQIIGERGLPIRSSSGVELLPTKQITDPQDYDNIVVVGGLLNGTQYLSEEKQDFLRRAAECDVPLTALCTGSFVLAHYGLLDNYRACVSWFHIKQFRDAFPDVRAHADTLFSIDGNRATCAGGAGAADLASYFVSKHVDNKAAEKASKILVLDRIRTGRDVQPNGELFPKAKSRHIRRALLLMESNLQEKITVTDVASKLGISRRQLERLFATEIETSPMAAYLALRLQYAKTLLGTSDLQIGEIAYRCGFPNAGHFSRVYRQHEGGTPTALRRG